MFVQVIISGQVRSRIEESLINEERFCSKSLRFEVAEESRVYAAIVDAMLVEERREVTLAVLEVVVLVVSVLEEIQGRHEWVVLSHDGSSPHGRQSSSDGSGGTAGTSSAQFAGRSSDENVVCRRIQHPVVALAGIVVMSRHFDETFVETQVVSDGVLPTLFVFSVVGEMPHDELVNSVQSQSLRRTVAYGHHYHGVVAVRRLFCSGVLLWVLNLLLVATFVTRGLTLFL